MRYQVGQHTILSILITLVFIMVSVLKFAVDTIIICLLEYAHYLLSIFYCGGNHSDCQNYYSQEISEDTAILMDLENMLDKFTIHK